MQFTGIKCDGCSKIKGETNAWLKIWKTAIAIAVTGSEVEDWVVARYDGTDKQFDICGQDCAIKKVAEFMGEMQK